MMDKKARAHAEVASIHRELADESVEQAANAAQSRKIRLAIQWAACAIGHAVVRGARLGMARAAETATLKADTGARTVIIDDSRQCEPRPMSEAVVAIPIPWPMPPAERAPVFGCVVPGQVTRVRIPGDPGWFTPRGGGKA